jgi:hypothetical protein
VSGVEVCGVREARGVRAPDGPNFSIEKVGKRKSETPTSDNEKGAPSHVLSLLTSRLEQFYREPLSSRRDLRSACIFTLFSLNSPTTAVFRRSDMHSGTRRGALSDDSRETNLLLSRYSSS